MFIPIGQKFFKNENGSALVWATVVVMALGLLTAGFLSLIRPVDHEKQQVVTYERMDTILYALATYFQKHTRLPCPADPDPSVTAQPFGAERGSGSDGDQVGGCVDTSIDSPAKNNPNQRTDEALRIGIVPFKTLGLSEVDVRDGWGNFITYRMAAPLDSDKLHKRCLTFTVPAGKAKGWTDEKSAAHDCKINPDKYLDDWVCPSLPGGNKHKNYQKAQFCCGVIEGDFDVFGPSGESLVYGSAGAPKPPWGAGGNPYGPDNSVKPDDGALNLPPLQDKLAVVLVSHGANGHGALLKSGLDPALPNTIKAEEEENANKDGIFIVYPKTLADSAFHDDIVVWRSQSQLMSELGFSRTGTQIDCSRPFP